ncbi:unnamed protein product [marine sediment metagenome]|uniref:Uncharacterized protein n=1 Tax=marine sediment metagenome TaxID=412755 RepID=X0UD57_9ZZZZ
MGYPQNTRGSGERGCDKASQTQQEGDRGPSTGKVAFCCIAGRTPLPWSGHNEAFAETPRTT